MMNTKWRLFTRKEDVIKKKKADTHRLNEGSMLALGEKRGRETPEARHYFMALLL